MVLQKIVTKHHNDFGEYKCMAMNQHGQATMTIELKRAYPPDPPTVEDLEFKPALIKVALVKPARVVFPIRTYVAQFKEYGSSWETAQERILHLGQCLQSRLNSLFLLLILC